MKSQTKAKEKTPEQLAKYLIDNTRELICYHEANGTYKYVNPTIKRIAGYEPEEMIGKNPYDFFHPDDHEYIQKTGHLPALNGENDTITEYRFRKKDGTYGWFQSLTETLYDENGNVEGLITSTRDISEIRRLRDESKMNETLLDEACKMTNVGPWEVDLETMNPIWSPKVYDIHEVDKNLKPDMSKALDYYPGKARETIETLVGESIEKGKPFDIVLPFVTAKGNQLWVRSIGRPEIQFGKTKKLYGVFQDVTKEVEGKNKMKRMVDFLTQQKQKLEDFNQIVSHNLRSPVANLAVLVEGLQTAKDEEEKETFLGYLKEVSQSLHNVLDDLVDVVKILQDKEVTKDDLEINLVLDSVVNMLMGDIIHAGAEIKLENEAWNDIQYPRIYMESILLNLISNAIKYAHPDRKPVITIRTSFAANSKSIEVEDNGSGIDLNRHGAKVFGLHKTFHPGKRGKGLGLFMTKNQIETMGGDISVASEEGKGSTFRIIFDRFEFIPQIDAE